MIPKGFTKQAHFLNLRDVEREITFPHEDGDALMQIVTAGKDTSGRGFTLSGLHLCLRGDVLVFTHDGNMVPISLLRAGDRVWTHHGHFSSVRAVGCRPAEEVSENGEVLEIRCWMNIDRVAVTPDHKVWTPIGWTPAKDLKKGDEIGTAIRRIAGTLKTITTNAVRDAQGRKKRGRDVIDLQLDKQFGFFCGYYLAEGSVHGRAPKYVSSVNFGHHQDELHFAMMAVKAVSSYITSYKSRKLEGKRATTAVYGSALARFITEHFGRKDEKRIPDWVFDAPREFVEGVALGYLAGDGSKTVARKQNYECPTLYATSVRPRLLYQFRHLLAALEWGWGGITWEKGFVDKRGWNNRPSWTLSISGRPALKIRKFLGLDSTGDLFAPSVRRTTSCKYRIADGYVWTKIREIIKNKAETVWDIEVDHPDHSFETVIGAVANSEAAHYKGGGEIYTSVVPAVSEHKDTIIVIESTPNGQDGDGAVFYEMWTDAINGKSEYVAVFLSWLDDEACVADESIARRGSLDKEERGLLTRGATMEQLAWRRWKISSPECGGSVELFHQEFPTTWEESFIVSGSPAFEEVERQWAAKNNKPPKWQGFIDPTDDGTLKLREHHNGGFCIWEDPLAGHYYYLGADAARGDDEKDSRDFAANVIFDGNTGHQACRFFGHVVPEVHACYLNSLGRQYNRAMVNGELTGGYGYQTLTGVRDILKYPNLYRWKGKDDKVGSWATGKNAVWFETTQHTRAMLYEGMRAALREGGGTNGEYGVVIYDSLLAAQIRMSTRKETGRVDIKKGNDDILFAAMLSNIAMRQYAPPRNMNPALSHKEEEDEEVRDKMGNRGDEILTEPQEMLINHRKEIEERISKYPTKQNYGDVIKLERI
jgi:hypothetical protein